MRAQLSPFLRRAVGFLLALAFTSLGAFAQSGLKADRASAEHFTKSLMALNAQYQTAPPERKRRTCSLYVVCLPALPGQSYGCFSESLRRGQSSLRFEAEVGAHLVRKSFILSTL